MMSDIFKSTFIYLIILQVHIFQCIVHPVIKILSTPHQLSYYFIFKLIKFNYNQLKPPPVPYKQSR